MQTMLTKFGKQCRDMNILFICTANIQRSVTAEKLFANCPKIETKSAGTHATHGWQINQELVNWADVIFVMSEAKDGHLTYLKNNFSLENKDVYDLNIPDVYERNNPELKRLLIERVSKHIDLKSCLGALLE